MNSFESALLWLDGKKAIIISILAAVLSYLVATEVITPNLGSLIQTILSILAGSAVLVTNSAVTNSDFSPLGRAVKERRENL